MTTVDLYLTREETFGLKVGGVKRVTCWLTKPRRELREAGTMFAGEQWISDTDHFTAKAFRDARATDIADAIWSHLEQTAFPGIPYEDWDDCKSGSFRDHPDSVPASSWIGLVRIAVETEPSAGATHFPVTITGPYGTWTEFRRPDRGAPNLAWLGKPRLHEGRENGPCPFEGIAARDCWHQPKGSGVIDASSFRKAGIQDAADAVDRALAMAPARIRRRWSRQVDLWVKLA